MKRKKSYSFIELAIAISLVGVISTISFASIFKKNINDKILLNKNRVEFVKKRMEIFFAKNGYLPCPSDITKPLGDKLATSEILDSTGSGCVGSLVVNNASANGKLFVLKGAAKSAGLSEASSDQDSSNVLNGGNWYFLGGGVPTSALGIDKSYAIDEYGAKIEYVVPDYLTNLKRHNRRSIAELRPCLMRNESVFSNSQLESLVNMCAQYGIANRSAADWTNLVNIITGGNDVSSILGFMDSGIFYKHIKRCKETVSKTPIALCTYNGYDELQIDKYLASPETNKNMSLVHLQNCLCSYPGLNAYVTNFAQNNIQKSRDWILNRYTTQENSTSDSNYNVIRLCYFSAEKTNDPLMYNERKSTLREDCPFLKWQLVSSSRGLNLMNTQSTNRNLASNNIGFILVSHGENRNYSYNREGVPYYPNNASTEEKSNHFRYWADSSWANWAGSVPSSGANMYYDVNMMHIAKSSGAIKAFDDYLTWTSMDELYLSSGSTIICHPMMHPNQQGQLIHHQDPLLITPPTEGVMGNYPTHPKKYTCSKSGLWV